MYIDIDLISTGQWTDRLSQSEIAEQEIDRARLYGLYDDVHIRALSQHPGHFEILGSPKAWLIAQLIQQPDVPVKKMDHLSMSELDGYYTPLKAISDHFIDRALALQSRIREQNLSLTDAGKVVGKSRSEVCNLMRILKMDEIILGKIKNLPGVGFGHAKIMAGLQYAQQLKLLELIKNEQLTVQKTEAVAKTLRENTVLGQVNAQLYKKSPDVLRLEMMLTEHFGVQVVFNEKDGLMEINYRGDLDILQGVLDKIGVTDL
jgi:ParB family chromosome partitioning protein